MGEIEELRMKYLEDVEILSIVVSSLQLAREHAYNRTVIDDEAMRDEVVSELAKRIADAIKEYVNEVKEITEDELLYAVYDIAVSVTFKAIERRSNALVMSSIIDDPSLIKVIKIVKGEDEDDDMSYR